MGFTSVDQVLWLISFFMQLALFAVLVIRRRVGIFPVFSTMIGFELFQNIANFIVYKTAAPHTYFWTYWALALIDTLLQLALVFEMARIVLRPTGTWVRDARFMFLALGALGAVLAFGLSFAVSPHAPSGLYAWTIRLDLFTSLLIAELVVAMSIAAQQLGLQGRNWVMGLGQGLMLWVGVSLMVETAHSYFGWTQRYVALDHLRIGASIVALGYWCVVFWRTEPERKPISPQMVKYLYSLHEKMEYDLRSIQARKHPR